MSNRPVRVNELLQRELSAILRQRYQSEAVAITITEVRVTPDLREARVFVGVIGNEQAVQKGLHWLRSKIGPISHELGRRIVLKYMPRFEFVVDESAARGNHLLKLIDDLVPPPPPEPKA
ncbi:MAG: 30S ribosome-binding factor RbfA [Opitutaceae bacterium]|nr:30S ribosome-binding factor RbfA [Opitutaceae bacterium]